MQEHIGRSDSTWDPGSEDCDENDEHDWDWGGTFVSGSDDPPEDQCNDPASD